MQFFLALRGQAGYFFGLLAGTTCKSNIATSPHSIDHRYISSNGLVSLKQESHTSFTTCTACTSSLQLGLAATLNAASASHTPASASSTSTDCA